MRVCAIALLFACSILGQTVGGLSSFPAPGQTGNLLTNPDFETWAAGAATGWTDYTGGAVQQSTAEHHAGASSLQLHNPGAYVSMEQRFTNIQAGIYSITAWVKYTGFGDGATTGARLLVRSPFSWPPSNVSSTSALLGGTSDWTQITISNIALSTAADLYVGWVNYGGTGDFYFDDVVFTRGITPISVFMKYPNFKGVVYDDKSQVGIFNIVVDPPSGTLGDYRIDATVTDPDDATVLTGTWAASADADITLDFTDLSAATLYDVTFNLIKTSDESNAGTYPAYNVVLHPASVRTGFMTSVDENNRILYEGVPKFILGVYDAGMGYVATVQGWTDQLTSQRRLFELPINYYLNYWYGGIDNTSAVPLLQALQAHGIGFLQTSDCYMGGHMVDPAGWWETASDGNAATRAGTQQFFGVYRADECDANAASDTFGYKVRTDALAPGSVTMGTMLVTSASYTWRDAFDAIGSDPYPILGDTPNDLSLISEWTLGTRAAVQDSRPVVIVLQYWNGGGGWPTLAELRNMTYMTIADGADGVVYWSLGTNALAYICDASSEEYARNLKVGKVGTAYTDILGLTGYFTPPHTWVVNSGSVPGLSIAGDGSITGTPSTAGSYYINATVDGETTGTLEIIVLDEWTTNYPSGAIGWCVARESNWSNLKSVTGEVGVLLPALATLDHSTALTSVDQASIHTRVKESGGYKWLIASNVTASTLNPTFTMTTSPATVAVYNESRTVTPSGATFTDSFGAYEAHVYQITDSEDPGVIVNTIMGGRTQQSGRVQ